MKLTANHKLKLKTFWHKAKVYASILTSIVLCAYIFNKWIEALLFVLAHLVLRPKFSYQFHVENTVADDTICLIITHLMLWVAIPLIPSIGQSFLSAIVFAFCTSYVGSIAQERLVLLAQKIIPFNCKNATAEVIQERARQRKLSNEQAEWVIDKYVGGKTFKQLCRENETEKACQMRIKRIVDKLNAPM